MKTRTSHLDFQFPKIPSAGDAWPDAYQHGCCSIAVQGRMRVLFARGASSNGVGGIIDPIIEAWKAPPPPRPLLTYETGLGAAEGPPVGCSIKKREWFDVCPVIH